MSDRDQAGHGREINPLAPDLYLAEERIAELEQQLAELQAARKEYCVEFYYWWRNQDGTNTEEGYAEWSRQGFPRGTALQRGEKDE